jgi:hypothetical protein
MNIKELAEQIARLETDEIYELAAILVQEHKVPALIFKADLELAE